MKPSVFPSQNQRPPLNGLLSTYLNVVIGSTVPTTGDSRTNGQEDRLWSQTAGVQNLSPAVGLGASYRTPLCLSEWTLTGMPHIDSP